MASSQGSPGKAQVQGGGPQFSRGPRKVVWLLQVWGIGLEGCLRGKGKTTALRRGIWFPQIQAQSLEGKGFLPGPGPSMVY